MIECEGCGAASGMELCSCRDGKPWKTKTDMISQLPTESDEKMVDIEDLKQRIELQFMQGADQMGDKFVTTMDCLIVIRRLQSELTAANARVESAYERGLENSVEACEREYEIFLDPSYSGSNPLSSFDERFGCTQCANAIRALLSQSKTEVTHDR
jgi:hypothetical protein